MVCWHSKWFWLTQLYLFCAPVSAVLCSKVTPNEEGAPSCPSRHCTLALRCYTLVHAQTTKHQGFLLFTSYIDLSDTVFTFLSFITYYDDFHTPGLRSLRAGLEGQSVDLRIFPSSSPFPSQTDIGQHLKSTALLLVEVFFAKMPHSFSSK